MVSLVIVVGEQPLQRTHCSVEKFSRVVFAATRERRMADRVSSPSSLSNGVASGSTPSRGSRAQEGPEEYYLSITSQPPSHVFPDEIFEIAFGLESYRVSPANSPPSNIKITVGLDSDPTANLTLSVIEEPRLSLLRKTGKTKCSIQCSQPIGKSRVSAKLRFSGTGVVGCSTPAITLVRAKLSVTVGNDWTDIWYKDEGGRDKSIETIVSARDSQDNILHEPIQLEIRLCYDAKGTPTVANQEILKRMGAADRGIQIDPETGKAKIRFRVEDVSKNHQGQNFVLKVYAAKTAGNNNIGPAVTPPINVRSKRNKKQRTTGARGSMQEMVHGERGTPIPSSSINVSYLSNEQIRDAVQDVIRWSEEVVNGMYHIQWRVMGYASNADGSVDYSRPYHNMQNPNPVVERLLALYNQSTRENIRYLQQRLIEVPSSPNDPYPAVRSSAIATSHTGMLPPSAMPPHTTPEMMGVNAPRGPYSMPGMPVHSPRYAEGSVAQHYQQPSHPRSEYYTPHLPAKAPPPQPPTHHERMDPLPAHPEGGGGDSAVSSMDRESEVEYVLARQYKSLRTGERLGFPAYSMERELLGFYRDSPRNTGVRQFIPTPEQDFGPNEKLQAKKILEDAIDTNSGAVQSVKDCGSIASVLDRCLVYEFSKDIGGGSK